jgi:hypothetical protein
MKKFLLPVAMLFALVGSASAASGILNWTLPVPATGLQAIQIWDAPDIAGVPSPNTQIGSVGPTVTTFTTPQLQVGIHTFTAVAVYAAGSAAPSNAAVLTITLTLPPVTNLTVTQGP